jgi:hypothetical protein
MSRSKSHGDVVAAKGGVTVITPMGVLANTKANTIGSGSQPPACDPPVGELSAMRQHQSLMSCLSRFRMHGCPGARG